MTSLIRLLGLAHIFEFGINVSVVLLMNRRNLLQEHCSPSSRQSIPPT